jgi:SulP family sulfate permease
MHLALKEFFPFLPWIRRYGRLQLAPDLTAGLTVAVVAVPQSMAYALIAGLPVQQGLYASVVPTIVACLWGSSAQLITGPTTAISLVVASALAKLATPGSADYLALALLLALLVGGVQVVMGVARLGNLLNFVSHSVILGFSTGAALWIAFKQIPSLLGLSLGKSHGFLPAVLQLTQRLHDTHLPTAALGLATMTMVLLLKRLRPTWPGTLIAMVLAGGATWLCDLAKGGVAVVGAIPRSLPPLSWPDLEQLGAAAELAPGTLAIAILGLVEAVSIAKSISGQTHQRLDINQEFIGQGLANMAAGLFGGYPGSGSFTRSAVNFRSGARTPMSGIFSGVAVAGMVWVAAPLAALLPFSVLSAVLIVVAFDMIHFSDLRRAIRTTRSDAAVLVVTFIATLMLNIEFAVYVGVLLSIGLHLAQTSHPRITSVVPESGNGRMIPSAFGHICCQMDIVRVEGSLFFGSAAYVLDDLQRRLRHQPHMANLLVRMHRVNLMDASGVHVLQVLLAQVRRCGGSLYFSGANPRVLAVFQNSGLLQVLGPGHVRTRTGSAIRQAMRESFCQQVCATCPVEVFTECSDLKRGNWEIFGAGIRPPPCVSPPSAGHGLGSETVGGRDP